ncbi:MAG: hypothetical protein ACD_79C00963G0009 [uncultured bacterium]|nr:MAG: hypothetical protein ACD_79C00963G0009 [uncultured bacterium]
MNNITYNNINPCKAYISELNSDNYQVVIYGIDSYDEEVEIASYRDFNSLDLATSKVREYRVPKSNMIFSEIAS